MKVHLWPTFTTPDNGDGGVRRVVEAQIKHLGAFGVELVQDPAAADVIATHIQLPDEYLRRFPGKAIVHHCHGFYWSEYRDEKGEPQWERWALQANLDVMKASLAADIVTSPTDWVSQAIRRNSCRDVRTVPHGIDIDEWPVGEPDERKYVLWNKSRPDPVCNPDVVYRVADVLPNVNFWTTMPGWSKSQPPGNVTLTGRVPYEESRKMVREAAVYLATTRETFGIGTLEAMAAGVPVVGFRWGGQKEFIEHGVDGWLAAPNDYDDLAEGIRWAMANRAEVGAAGRAKAMQFPWERAAEMYAAIYRDAAERRIQRGPKVSVIVTAYNLEAYLPMALASVLAQDRTFTDWECVIVDDASPDGCGRIADEWAQRDKRFRAIHNEHNLYLAGARNRGVAESRGRYILPLDADDMLGDGALRALADALDADRLTWVAYGGVHFVAEDGITAVDYGTGRPGYSGWPVDFRVDHQLAAPQAGRRPNNLLPYSSMIRREALEWTGGWRERRKTAEDADLWCRLSSYGFIPKRVTSAPCLIYRNREDSMSRTNTPDDWTAWYPWSRLPELFPGGALRTEHLNTLDVPSCDPPVISVIIPVGPGHETKVKDAVDSVDAQTFRQWEIIVVNDAGKPLAALPTYVRTIETAGGIGPAAARNLGIRAAKGKLFLPLDADDTLQPNALRVMFEEHQKDGAIIYSDFFEDPEHDGEFRVYQCPEFEPRILAENGMAGAVTQLTPIEAWRKVGGYDEDLPAWEDWAFQIKLCHAGYCARRVPTPLWTYRKHTGTRRDVQYARRNDPGGAKESIVRKFPGLWPGAAADLGIAVEGEYTMGCNSCGGGGGGSARIEGIIARGQQPVTTYPKTAVLVEYIGNQQGSIEYRANTEAVYRFAAGDPPKWVHPDDGEYFRERDSIFRIVDSAAPPVSEPQFAPQIASDDPMQPEQVSMAESPDDIAANVEELDQKRRRSRAKAGQLPAGVTLNE